MINGKDFYWQFGLKWHNGVDYGTPVWTPLFAWIEWEVSVKNQWKNGYGLSVSISKQRVDGSTGIIYAHLSKTDRKTWDKVKVGDLIGYSGNTGASTWPHLHLGIRFRELDGTVIDYNNGYFWRTDPQKYFVGGQYSM